MRLEPVASGFELPVHVAFRGTQDPRWFVVEQAGRIQVVLGSQVRPFLDLRGRVETGGEKGLLSLAFHPQVAQNGLFYVNYTRREGGRLKTFVSEFRTSADPDVADPASERVLFTVDQPFRNHNGGLVLFGPDGFLYVGMGDGGSADDPLNNAQNPASLLGKVLRVDPRTGTPQVWATGFRNPWRFSFDRGTGRMFLGDVGQDRREEVDVVEPRGNYGWAVMEGTLCNKPEVGCDPLRFRPPAAEYPTHEDGTCSVTGGYVYRALALRGSWGGTCSETTVAARSGPSGSPQACRSAGRETLRQGGPGWSGPPSSWCAPLSASRPSQSSRTGSSWWWTSAAGSTISWAGRSLWLSPGTRTAAAVPAPW